MDLDDSEKTPTNLIEMLGFDYFTLLDLVTIARSRKHIEQLLRDRRDRTIPDRLRPVNIKADVDRAGQFRPIKDINLEIRRLNLAAYAPLRYVLPGKQAAYDAKYSTKVRGGERVFRQADREESLIHLLRVNILKRMESSVVSFALTVRRQLEDVEATLARIEARRGVPGGARHRGRRHRGSGVREPARRPQGQGPAQGRGPRPLEAGPDRGSQSAGHLHAAAETGGRIA